MVMAPPPIAANILLLNDTGLPLPIICEAERLGPGLEPAFLLGGRQTGRTGIHENIFIFKAII
jgi:hypothetical protein